MTESTCTPRGGAESLTINNPNLPEGFKITEEMLLDPAVKFFLENYAGPYSVTIGDGELNGNAGVYFFDTHGNIITEVGDTSFPASRKILKVELDFFDPEFIYGGSFLINGKKYRANNGNTNRDLLKNFLSPESGYEFPSLFEISDIYIKQAAEVRALIMRISGMIGLLAPQLNASPEEQKHVEYLRKLAIERLREVLGEIENPE